MVTPLIREIRDNVLSKNPNTFAKGYYDSRQYQDGKIVTYDEGEGEYVGLMDTKYNYFYIRFLDSEIIDQPIERTTSCKEQGVAVPLRLVAWVNKGDLTKLSEVLLHDIITTRFTLSTDEKKRYSKFYPIIAQEIILDGERIFKEETLKPNDKVKAKKGVTLCAVDFTLRFNYKPPQDVPNCIDRDICVPCN